MANTQTEQCLYTVIFKTEDGEHTAELHYTKWDDKRAEHWAKKFYDKPDEGMTFVSIDRATQESHAKAVAKNLAENPSRVPLDEKTGGEPNRVVSDPSLASKDA